MKKAVNSCNDQFERILSILAVQSEEEAVVNEDNLDKYLAYLKNEIEMPCLVTGIENLGFSPAS